MDRRWRATSGDAPASGALGAADLPALLARSARGDEAAFAEVYDQVGAKVYGLALQVVRAPALAQEVAQESFLEVWRTAGRYDPDRGSALAWILTITHSRAVDRVRSVESAARRDVTYQQENQSISHDSTAEGAEASLESRRVRTALGSLTEVQREVVELSYLRGYTHTEIAAMLELPLGTVKTRIRDGLIRLRDTLGVGGAR